MDNEGTLRWAAGIPAAGELSPLNTSLITPVLAAAFNVDPDCGPRLTEEEVEEAAQRTVLGTERVAEPSATPSEEFRAGSQQAGFAHMGWQEEQVAMPDRLPGGEAPGALATLQGVHGNMPAYGSFSAGKESSMDRGGKKRRPRPAESLELEDNLEGMEPMSDDLHGRVLKRPRLVWTPQLHKRFCDAVNHLGLENAVPKTIMQLMNVEGLTRENVASHLQKYRLYLRQRFQSEGGPPAPSSSDPVFAAGPQPSRSGPSSQPSPAASADPMLPPERVTPVGAYAAGNGMSTSDGAPPRAQDVGYRDFGGGHPGSRQLAGRPGAEQLEVDPFGRPLKRAKFVDERGLTHRQLP